MLIYITGLMRDDRGTQARCIYCNKLLKKPFVFFSRHAKYELFSAATGKLSSRQSLTSYKKNRCLLFKFYKSPWPLHCTQLNCDACRSLRRCDDVWLCHGIIIVYWSAAGMTTFRGHRSRHSTRFRAAKYLGFWLRISNEICTHLMLIRWPHARALNKETPASRPAHTNTHWYCST